jgi:hypothetical protein
MIIFNCSLDLFRLHPLESFEQYEIFNILNDMIVDVLECFCSIEPFILILFVDIAVPYPIPSILDPLNIFLLFNELFLCFFVISSN